jgi:DNA-binding CsgD family transcriptional regulator
VRTSHGTRFCGRVLAIFDGDLDDADSLLKQGETDGVEPGQSPLNERLRIQLALALGDFDAAAARCRTLTPLIQLTDQQPYPAASLQLVLADVAAEKNEVREAEKAVQCALGISTAELPLVSVDGLELLAVLLSRRDRSADAGRLLGATEAFRDQTGYRFRFPFRSLQVEQLRLQLDSGDLAAGAEMSLADALVLAQGTRGKRGRPSFGWDSLTPTEARIAELVAGGCTNGEIAEKLFVAVATVKTHLVHVYEKLGLRSRAELAAYAARREASC